MQFAPLYPMLPCHFHLLTFCSDEWTVLSVLMDS